MIQTCALGDVVDVSAGQPAPKPDEFSVEGVPFIRAGSLENLLNGGTEADCEKVPDSTAKSLRLRLYPKDTVLFAKSGMSATLGRVYRLRRSAYVVSHLAALVPKGAYDPAYLTYWLRYHSPAHLIKDPAYPSIRLPDIEQLQVPDLPLSEQCRISTVLDKTDAIRRKQGQVDTFADEFLRATFAEMFGDLFENRKNWPTKPLEELLWITPQNGLYRPSKDCPSSEFLRHLASPTKGGSGPSVFDIKRPARGAASGDLRSSVV